MTFSQSLKHLNTSLFKDAFKSEFSALKPESLPLHQATTQGGYVNYSSIGLSILSIEDKLKQVKVKTGIFFTEIVGGCNCDDAPFEVNNYCILLITIDKLTASCSFSILDD